MPLRVVQLFGVEYSVQASHKSILQHLSSHSCLSVHHHQGRKGQTPIEVFPQRILGKLSIELIRIPIN